MLIITTLFPLELNSGLEILGLFSVDLVSDLLAFGLVSGLNIDPAKCCLGLDQEFVKKIMFVLSFLFAFTILIISNPFFYETKETAVRGMATRRI